MGKRIHIVTALGVLILAALPAVAFDPKQEFMVSCPAHWPGAITQPPPLTYSEAWIHAISSPKPNDVTIEVNATEPEEASINCRYGDNRFVTVVIPGITSVCYPWRDNSTPPPRYMYGCLTRPESDGTLKPARTYIVEPVTLKTRIDGLGLGMSRAEILDIAKARGYSVVDGESNPMRLRLGEEDVTVAFAKSDGLSKDIVFWFEPREGTRYRETVYRFGLDADISSKKYPDGRSRDSYWPSVTDSSEIEILREPNDKRLTIHLRDRAAE